MAEETQSTKSFNLDSFTKAKQTMIATNENYYGKDYAKYWRSNLNSTRDYTPEEIDAIISHGILTDQQKLSTNYFNRDGYYKQIILYYATLLKYQGLLIPNVGQGKSLSTSHIQKRYYNAIDYIDNMNLPVWLTNCAQRALVNGVYYGVKATSVKNKFTVIDLPTQYCCSRFKDADGNDLIEFDLSYFDSIADEEQRKIALDAYPEEISKAYKKFKKSSELSKWYVIPSSIGICFPFFDGRPPFLSIIPASIDYDFAVSTEQTRDDEETRKIIVQKIPHTTDGRLLFEPDEAAEIHAGTVGMLKGNKNVSVLTTYADVDAIVSKASADNTEERLNRIEQNIYAQAGVSSQLFATTGSGAMESSINKDTAFMMYLANKFALFITNHINLLFGNSNITFKYLFLPITYYNTKSYVETANTLVSYGYSFLIPAAAMGISQKDLGNLKDLENNLLKLNDKLKPLQSAFTQSSKNNDDSDDDSTTVTPLGQNKEGGATAKNEGEKSDTTLKKEESLDKMGGGTK